MDDTSGDKTAKTEVENRIDAFLLSALENAPSTMTNEREMADRMVNHFFTLVVAFIGGFVCLITEKTEQHPSVRIYVLLVGFVLLVFGIAVFIRLIKCHFDRKAFHEGRKELYHIIKTRYKETHLASYYQSIEKFNKELGNFPWLYKYILNWGVLE